MQHIISSNNLLLYGASRADPNLQMAEQINCRVVAMSLNIYIESKTFVIIYFVL